MIVKAFTPENRRALIIGGIGFFEGHFSLSILTQAVYTYTLDTDETLGY